MPERRPRIPHGGDREHDHDKTADTLEFEHRFPLEQRSNFDGAARASASSVRSPLVDI